MTNDTAKPKSDRSKVRRMAKRGSYDESVINAIVDEAYLCHVGLVTNGQPIVIPMIHGRVDQTIYLHGSNGSRLLRAADSTDICLTFTLLDALVHARSMFHHSMNYRSAVVFGRGRIVDDRDEFLIGLRAITDNIDPNRWGDAREPNEKEILSTNVVAVEIVEASAKSRSGPPIDDEEDYALPVWAGIVPLRIEHGTPVRDPALPDDIPLPDYLSNRKPR